MIAKWISRKAKLFILEQRRTELENAIARWKDSTKYAQRRIELAEIENEINTLNEER